MDFKVWYIHTVKYYSVIKMNKGLIHVTTWINPKNILEKKEDGYQVKRKLY